MKKLKLLGEILSRAQQKQITGGDDYCGGGGDDAPTCHFCVTDADCTRADLYCGTNSACTPDTVCRKRVYC